ncbi:MAG: response regulator [Geothermobacteraceae bacterium]
MSFTGDLEHLPIVDVIQLLHSTRKSGTLTVQGNGRQSQLVFSEGYIVSANHSNLSVRIGQILVELQAITAEDRDQALKAQADAGEERKPLIAMLIESGKLSREDAYRGLEILIELTIVEILTWESGTFTLDLDRNVIADEYRYFPEKCQQEINLDTQNILMDALRIYDEKVRDGDLSNGIFQDSEAGQAPESTEIPEAVVVSDEDVTDTQQQAVEAPDISVEDLGLDVLDNIEPKIPEVFSALEDRDELEEHRQAVVRHIPWLSDTDQKRLVEFLKSYGTTGTASGEGHDHIDIQRQAVVLYSQDPFTRHTATTACRHTGVMSFSSETANDLEPIIDQSLDKNIVPVLVFDAPEPGTAGFGPGELAALRTGLRSKYPDIPLIQMGNPGQTMDLLQALKDGATGVLPKPNLGRSNDHFVDEMILFLEAFASLVHNLAALPASGVAGSLHGEFHALQEVKDAPDVAYTLLRVVRKFFARAMTMIVTRDGLVVEKCLGISEDLDAKTSVGLQLDLVQGGLIDRVIRDGAVHSARGSDPTLDKLYQTIQAPKSDKILLLPMKVRGRVVSITYADFGQTEPRPVPANLFEIMATQAGLSLENTLLRRQMESARK